MIGKIGCMVLVIIIIWLRFFKVWDKDNRYDFYCLLIIKDYLEIHFIHKMNIYAQWIR